ncbi:MAG: aquaporin Z [Bacteroidetes bacterium]|nr:aquaporin Z [Bacteroidota bacterium]
MNSSKKYVAEFFGTLVLVLIGCGSAVIAGTEISFMGISFAFGLAVLTMVYTIGNISGCHINPAITIAMLTAGKINGKETVGYIISQCLGAIAGAGILLMIAKGIPGYSLETNGLGQNGFGEFSPMKYSMEAGFIAEVVLTFIFLLVIFGSTSDDAPKGFAGIAIGLSLVMIHLVSIPITGTSVNPARSLGPALFAGANAVGQLWLFWLAPILGGVLAALVWKNLLAKK